MSDPLYRAPEPRDPPEDPVFLRALTRRHWLKLASGAAALALIAAILITAMAR